MIFLENKILNTMPRKICNECGKTYQDNFFYTSDKSCCSKCKSTININKYGQSGYNPQWDEEKVSNEGSSSRSPQFISAQAQMSAYEKKVTYDKFQDTLRWLEKYVEIVYKDDFPDWENRKQFRDDGIPRKDIDDDPERAEKLLSIMFYSFEGFTRHPDLLEKMKEEFYQWISAIGINVNNCPEKLKHYLFGLYEILEGRGEKISEEVKNRRRDFDVNSPEYAEGLNEFFAALQVPLRHAREEEQALAGKKYDDLKVGGKFSGVDAKKGENVLEEIKNSVSGFGCRSSFNYFPQKEQQRINLVDDDEEMVDYSSKSDNSKKQQTGYNRRAVIEGVKRHKGWRVDDIFTGTEEETCLVGKDARLDDYNRWTGELNFKGNPIYRKQDFSEEEWEEIEQSLNISKVRRELVDDIKRNKFIEVSVVDERGRECEKVFWIVRKSFEVEKDEKGYLKFNHDNMYVVKDLTKEEKAAIGYNKLEKASLQSSNSTPNTPKNDNRFGTGGIIAAVAGVSALVIGGTVAIRGKLARKKSLLCKEPKNQIQRG